MTLTISSTGAPAPAPPTSDPGSGSGDAPESAFASVLLGAQDGPADVSSAAGSTQRRREASQDEVPAADSAPQLALALLSSMVTIAPTPQPGQLAAPAGVQSAGTAPRDVGSDPLLAPAADRPGTVTMPLAAPATQALVGKALDTQALAAGSGTDEKSSAVGLPGLAENTGPMQRMLTPGQTTAALPGQTTAALPGQTTAALPGQTTVGAGLPGQITEGLPGQTTAGPGLSRTLAAASPVGGGAVEPAGPLDGQPTTTSQVGAAVPVDSATTSARSNSNLGLPTVRDVVAATSRLAAQPDPADPMPRTTTGPDASSRTLVQLPTAQAGAAAGPATAGPPHTAGSPGARSASWADPEQVSTQAATPPPSAAAGSGSLVTAQLIDTASTTDTITTTTTTTTTDTIITTDHPAGQPLPTAGWATGTSGSSLPESTDGPGPDPSDLAVPTAAPAQPDAARSATSDPTAIQAVLAQSSIFATNRAGRTAPVRTAAVDPNQLSSAGIAGQVQSLTAAAVVSAPTAPATPAPLYQQLARPILRLRATGNGEHSITINLHPADLGPVSIDIRLRDGQLSVDLASANSQAREALGTALPALHSELSRAGLTDVNLSLHTATDSAGGSWNGPAAGRGQHQPGPADRSRTSPATGSEPAPTRPSTASATGIDRWL